MPKGNMVYLDLSTDLLNIIITLRQNLKNHPQNHPLTLPRIYAMIHLDLMNKNI